MNPNQGKARRLLAVAVRWLTFLYLVQIISILSIMKIYVFIISVILFFLSCGKDEPVISNNFISYEEALSILFNDYFRRDDPTSIIMRLDTLFMPGDSIKNELYDKTYTPYSFNTPKWVFFVDNSYLYNSYPQHSGSHVFIDYHDGSIYSSLSNIPSDITHYDTVYYEWKRQNLEYPNLSFNDSLLPNGCIDFEIYLENEDENAFIWVKADTSKLKLSDRLQQFDLNIQYEGLAVGIDFYYYLPPNSISMAGAYCNDLLFYKDPPRIFTAEAGNIFLKVFSDTNITQGYAAYVRLENILFRDHEGRTVQLDQCEVKSVRVGWYPG